MTTGRAVSGDFTVTVSVEGDALRLTGPARTGRLEVPDAVPAHSGSPDQRRLDEEFGVGAVRLTSVMRSITEGPSQPASQKVQG